MITHKTKSSGYGKEIGTISGNNYIIVVYGSGDQSKETCDKLANRVLTTVVAYTGILVDILDTKIDTVVDGVDYDMRFYVHGKYITCIIEDKPMENACVGELLRAFLQDLGLVQDKTKSTDMLSIVKDLVLGNACTPQQSTAGTVQTNTAAHPMLFGPRTVPVAVTQPTKITVDRYVLGDAIAHATNAVAGPVWYSVADTVIYNISSKQNP